MLTALVVVAFLSDKLKLRGVIMLFTLPIAIVGYAVIANISGAKIKYGMTFLMATGMYSSVPCILVWNSNNSAGHFKRATTSAMQLAIANCGGFVASKINQPTGLCLTIGLTMVFLISLQLSQQRQAPVSPRPHYHPGSVGLCLVHVSPVFCPHPGSPNEFSQDPVQCPLLRQDQPR